MAQHFPANDSSSDDPGKAHSAHPQPEHWHTFEEILQRLHQQGVYVHPEQLAEFLLAHGLPVNLRYVPAHLQQKAIRVNDHYQGDMARLENLAEEPWYLVE